MWPKRFTYRTSALKRPPSIYGASQRVVERCEHCQLKGTLPSRSRLSGLRATTFGDWAFLDHAEVKILRTKYIVLLIVDAATSLLAAYPQKTTSADETLDNFREWMETYQCTPKTICADMAFTADKFASFYRHHGIRPLPTGPGTPWPNRAEAAVRLLKLYLRDFLVDVGKHPELKKVTPRSLLRKAAMARKYGRHLWWPFSCGTCFWPSATGCEQR